MTFWTQNRKKNLHIQSCTAERTLIHSGNRYHSIVQRFNYFVLTFRERERALAQAGAPVIQPQRSDGPRFTGGGFNLKAAKTAA